MDTEQMQTLLEIKKQVCRLSAIDFDISTQLEALDTHTQILKETLREEIDASNAHNQTFKAKRLLKHCHMYRSIAYQEVKVNVKGDIVRYGDVYFQGLGKYAGANRGDTPHFTRVCLPSHIEFVEVYGGYMTFYALPKEGDFIYVWGLNSKGEAGVGNTSEVILPTRVDLPSRPIKILSGSPVDANQSVIMLCADKNVYVCGHNGTGQLGVGNNLSLSSFTQNPHLSNIKDIAFESYGAYGLGLALDSDNALYTWGHNVQGACGNGANANVLIPFKLEFNKQITALYTSVGNNYATSFILFDDGSARGAGYGLENQLSLNAPANSNIFTELQFEGAALQNLAKIYPATFGGVCFGLDRDGKLYAWGKGTYGYGGSLTSANASAHQVCEAVLDLQIDARNTRAIAKTQTNALIAFGLNTNGGLGVGNVANQSSFVPVITPPNVQDFTLYNFNTESYLVVLADNEIYACGTTNNSALKYTTPTLQKQS